MHLLLQKGTGHISRYNKLKIESVIILKLYVNLELKYSISVICGIGETAKMY